MLGITLIEGCMMQHKQLGFLHAGRLRGTVHAIYIACGTERVSVWLGRKICCRPCRQAVLHGVKACAQRFFLCGVTFQVGSGRRLALIGSWPRGIRPGLQQPPFPANLLAFIPAMRALAVIEIRMVVEIRRIFHTRWRRLESAIARPAVKGNLGKRLGAICRHAQQYRVLWQARNRAVSGEDKLQIYFLKTYIGRVV